MSSQKYEAMLNLALDVSVEERELSTALDVGYNSLENTWEVIIRYAGDIEFLREYGVTIVYLEGNYAILTVPASFIRRLSEFTEIIYVEMPKSIYFTIANGVRTSCVNPVQAESFPGGGLTGEGVICACIDSGIDIYSRIFRNNDGTTRLLEMWDQNIDGNPPEGFTLGSVFLQEEINKLIEENVEGISNASAPGRDVSGHGTHVNELKHNK